MAVGLKVENFCICLSKFSKQDFRNNNNKDSSKLNLGNKSLNWVEIACLDVVGQPGKTCISCIFYHRFLLWMPRRGKGWIAPSEILQSLTLAFFVTDTVLLKFIWLCSVLLENWVNYWVEQKDNFLSTDSEVEAIYKKQVSLPEEAKLDIVSVFEK